MATQNLSDIIPALANDPLAVLADPLAVAGCFPTLDYRLTTPDCVPAGQFSRLSTGYRTLPSGLLQSVAAGGLRIDYDPVTGANLGALLEESRTNYLQQSSAIVNGTALKAPWADVGGLTYKTDGTVAPDGNLATLLTSTGNGDPIVYQNTTTFPASTLVCYGAFIKPGSSQFVRLDLPSYSITFNLIALTFSPTSGTTAPAAYGYRLAANGFVYVWIQNAVASASTTIRCDLRPYASATASGGSIYHGGSELEPGAFPTSYIPTTSAPATRAADSLVVPVTSDWFNPNEGTVFVDTFVPAGVGTSGFDGLMTFDDGSGNNLIGLYFNSDGSVHGQVVVSGKYVDIGTGALGLTAGTNIHCAISYNASTLSLSVNGSPVATTAMSNGLATNLSSMHIGAWATGAAPYTGRIRRASYLPRAQSAAVLQRMSTTLSANPTLATTYRPGLMSPADKINANLAAFNFCAGIVF